MQFSPPIFPFRKSWKSLTSFYRHVANILPTILSNRFSFRQGIETLTFRFILTLQKFNHFFQLIDRFFFRDISIENTNFNLVLSLTLQRFFLIDFLFEEIETLTFRFIVRKIERFFPIISIIISMENRNFIISFYHYVIKIPSN